ncbi:hypothetical protein Rumeso_02786 [Rubellimicrobium mesophilum DSM 19309]|uniref:Uncharacterized protein n=1 Tax=Rubellimicrobium mesophilum DSM 19309 TaxID=442562 RepID=A0A017HPK7_9RHOB|nr:hypothetical protein [Rubellimicrobium mesophilum]EYD75699.1 hypothetical protein Rumeso_02786 [Rubellimicrobium mesophilum DSM 19309]
MRALSLSLALGALPLAALADGGVAVPLADVSGLSPAQAEELLTALVTANVVSSNCPGFGITDGEWTLITGTADRLAYEELGLSVDDYDARFYGPAFALLDQPGTCEAEGPKVRGIVQLLVDMGGSPVPVGPAKG